VTLVPIHTPGHASDHLCFYLEEERALFSGDLILNGSTTVIPEEDGDLGLYMDSLRRVQALGVERIYPAHGPVVEDAPAKIQEYIDHRLLRERQILDALGNGAATIPDIVKVVYAEVPTMLHKMAGQSVHSHLKKLARDGRVREAPIDGAPSRWALA
jgi:glyoxylase-like metal-dependent hydrolase (beta-lactamase superfamily II)